jgi:GntR family transcriptional regulator, transcriptional repressor for pyruvate dehydrogenase complex
MDSSTSGKGGGTRAPKLSHALVEFFRARIASGELKPGDTLPPEAELLQQLRVSRPTLRQALRVLESESLIRLGKGARTGATVMHPSIETAAQYGALYLATHGATLGEIHQVRALLEPPLAALIARQANTDAVKSLQDCVRTQQEALQRGDYIAAATAVNDFHGRLERFSQNRALGLVAGMLNDIAVNVYPQIPIATRNAKERNLIWRRSEKSTEAHAHLVKLIAAGKADAAEKFWREYMLDTADFIQKSGLATLRVLARESHLSAENATQAARNLRALQLRGP